MFKSLEVGRQIKGSEFDELAPDLQLQLLTAQRDLAGRDYPLIIVIAGLEGAGKGALIHRLNEWMDPRGIDTNTFWEHSDEQESHPYFWRFWRKLPPRGETGIFLGSWYSRPALGAMDKSISDEDFERRCRDILAFERALVDDGALIVKLWLHVTKDTREAQLQGKAPGKQQNPRVTDQPYDLRGGYKEGLKVAERMILATDTSDCPWNLIEAEDRHYRDITAGQIILGALQARAQADDNSNEQPAVTTTPTDTVGATVLSGVDLSQRLEREQYKQDLADYQARLQDLAWDAYRANRSMIAVFEGWDAAGKGSAIRRVTRAVDPRLFHLVQFAAPTDEEKAHHYLWRFWRQLERDGRATIFDRSWYGRVLVERVEGFASEEQWRRAYSEINQFESELVAHGSILSKFWLHISKDEQLARFKAREETPRKQHKITPEDWRNREKWDAYEQAVDDMVMHTSTSHAPWTLISGNDKLFARIQILKTCCDALESALGQDNNGNSGEEKEKDKEKDKAKTKPKKRSKKQDKK